MFLGYVYELFISLKYTDAVCALQTAIRRTTVKSKYIVWLLKVGESLPLSITLVVVTLSYDAEQENKFYLPEEAGGSIT